MEGNNVTGRAQNELGRIGELVMRALEQSTEAMKLANNATGLLSAHERQCTERWVASRDALNGVVQRLKEQDTASIDHRRMMYTKVDGINARLSQVFLGALAGSLSVIITLAVFILTHPWK